jgi:hypothetical protein
MEDFIQLTDAYQIAFIVRSEPSIEEAITYTVSDGFTFAKIPMSNKVARLISEYNNGGTINARDFTRTIKRIRGFMIQKKFEKKGIDNGHTQPAQ